VIETPAEPFEAPESRSADLRAVRRRFHDFSAGTPAVEQGSPFQDGKSAFL